MIVRLLLMAALVWLIVRVWRQWRLNHKQASREQNQERFEVMSRCTGCGVYLPANTLSVKGRCGKCSGT